MYLNSRLEDKFIEQWDGDYNSGLGRFISEDPIGLAGLDANMYRYVYNNSNRYNDPFGYFALPLPIIVVGPIAPVIGIGVGIGLGIYATITLGEIIADKFEDAYSKNKSFDQEFVPGDFEDVQDEFIDKLIEGGGIDFETDGDVIIGDLENGDKIIGRPYSSEDFPTLEVQGPPNSRGKRKVKSKKRFCK